MTYFLDLFSGIGGFALGTYWAGLRFDEHYFSEVNDYAIKVYQQRFPDAIGLGDIRKIRGQDLPKGDWITCGGFPCQDISVAGKGAGLAGERSGLWFEYARLIGEVRPRYAIMENVGALSFRGLDTVLGSLAEIGYDAEWCDIRASDVGAPHKRERIWIVGYPHDDGFDGSQNGKSIVQRSNTDKTWKEELVKSSGSGCSGETDVAYPTSREPREQTKWEGRQDIIRRSTNSRGSKESRGETLADSDSVRMERQGAKFQTARTGRTGKDVAYASGEGLEGWEKAVQLEKGWHSDTGYDRKKIGSSWRNSQWDSEPGFRRVSNELP